MADTSPISSFLNKAFPFASSSTGSTTGALGSGGYKMQDDSVANRVTGLMSSNSPLMQQARTQGLQAANKRGLLNSSMAVGAAQDSTYKVALPIASQEAQQAAAMNQLAMENASQERIAGMNIASNDREKAASLAAAFENSYGEMWRTVASQPDIPADVRNKYLNHINALRDSNLALVEQMYGINLDWATPKVV